MQTDIRFATALASIRVLKESHILDLTEDDLKFLTRDSIWLSTDRSRARRCIEACIYGALDVVGFPRLPAPAEFVAATIAFYVSPVNLQSACLIMEGAEFTEHVIQGVEAPLSGRALFAFTLNILAGDIQTIHNAQEHIERQLTAQGV